MAEREGVTVQFSYYGLYFMVTDWTNLPPAGTYTWNHVYYGGEGALAEIAASPRPCIVSVESVAWDGKFAACHLARIAPVAARLRPLQHQIAMLHIADEPWDTLFDEVNAVDAEWRVHLPDVPTGVVLSPYSWGPPTDRPDATTRLQRVPRCTYVGWDDYAATEGELSAQMDALLGVMTPGQRLWAIPCAFAAGGVERPDDQWRWVQDHEHDPRLALLTPYYWEGCSRLPAQMAWYTDPARGWVRDAPQPIGPPRYVWDIVQAIWRWLRAWLRH